MVFSSFEFLFRFLPVFLLMYYVTPQKWKNAVLFAGSILFYTAGEAEYVVLLLASVVINCVFGRLMYRVLRGKREKTADFADRGAVLRLWCFIPF